MKVNGKSIPLKDTKATTLYELILLFGFKPEAVAVEYNRKLPDRLLWKELTLNDDDEIEIIHFIGGGA